ncbi:hypothetical protein ASswx1_359 [Aeromonas phage Asswx_1]|uniref:Uncharacterized protein n=1 Tax=Aeromonas phage Asswx_1 TaxID=2419739 RepID=A0A411B8Q7_9CAUD|nr:hypothetical protein ASswx1_359 [Aeromonas phage Asswx_1]
MKITTYAKKVFKNEIDVFGNKLGFGKYSGLRYQYGMNKFINTLQRMVQMNEYYEPTCLKGFDKHVYIRIKDLEPNDFSPARWVISFHRKPDSGEKMIEQICRIGRSIESMTKQENFDIGTVVTGGKLQSVSFVFYK